MQLKGEKNEKENRKMNREQKRKSNRKRFIFEKHVNLYKEYVKIKNGNTVVNL